MREKDDRTMRVQDDELRTQEDSDSLLSDLELKQLVRRWFFHFAGWQLAQMCLLFGIGAMIGSLIASMASSANEPWYSPLLAILGVSTSLALLWLLSACVVLLFCRRTDRFDLCAADAFSLRQSARRSFAYAIGLTGLSLVAIIPTMLLSPGDEGIARTVWIVVAIGGILVFRSMPRLRPARQLFEWPMSNLCRRCGYDRGQSVSVCPECGEKAHG